MASVNRYFRISPAQGPPLRIGLLLDSREEISASFAKIIADIQGSNFAKIELLVVRRQTLKPAQISGSRLRSIIRSLSDSKLRRRLLYTLYLRLDARQKQQPDPVAAVDCRNLLSGTEMVEVEPIGKKFVHRFPDEAVENIRSKNLDVLLRFGFNILHGDILKSARYGVWSYHHGDNEFYRGGPAHFWELYEGSLLSGVMLQVLSEELDAGLVLCKSLFATEGGWSMSRNRFTAYWGSTDLVIRKLNELHQYGWESIREKALPSTPYQGKRKIYKTPTNMELVRWLVPVFLKKAVSHPFRKATVQHWRIGSRINGRPLYDCAGEPDVSGFRWIDSPKGHFWADPFAFEYQGQDWAFFEDYSYQGRRASIACAPISATGELGTPLVCLNKTGHHYSYPHIFRAGSEIFMVPEAVDSKCVTLFRCEQFPNQWKEEAVLLEGRFVDTTIWEHEGLWWLMTTSAEPSSRAGALLLFYSESIRGEWHFHPANPISTDIRRNRGGGALLKDGDRMIRTSQASAPIYGYSITFNEVTTLSTQRYEERAMRTISPEYWKGLAGIHTYNRVGKIELIDGQNTMALKEV
jgi:hypothetical protein